MENGSFFGDSEFHWALLTQLPPSVLPGLWWQCLLYGSCVYATPTHKTARSLLDLGLVLHFIQVEFCVLPLPHWQSFCPLGPATSSKASFL